MATTLGQLDFKSNAIGFLRIVLASVVLLSHGWHMGGFGREPLIEYSHGIFSAGYLAVGGFFTLSGFLITRSGETTSGPTRFLWHRILRIYPGFWVCLVVTAFVIAPIIYAVQTGSLHGFLAMHNGPIAYVIQNASLILLQQNIGSLMAAYAYPETINGSLWTLAWEFNSYVCVGVFGIFTIYRFPKLAPVAVVLLIAASLYFEKMVHSPILIGLIPTLGLFIFFWLGSSAYLFRDRIPMHRAPALASVVIIAAALPTDFRRELVPIPVAYLVLYAALRVPVRSFDRRVDLSYGLYLYGMPVEKLATSFGLNRGGMLAYFLIVMAAGLTVAAASWFLVERPSLSLRALTVGISQRQNKLIAGALPDRSTAVSKRGAM
jgi:peptidoglycan/LPS O-acetylase OafA/YrhL